MSWKSLLDQAQARGVDPLGARGRWLIALAVLLMSAVLLPLPNWLERSLRRLGRWGADLAGAGMAGAGMAGADQGHARDDAAAGDENTGRYGVFVTVLVSSFVNLAAAIYALRRVGLLGRDGSR